ncbi:hypothetical protein MAR_036662 [Mya arenaria]|uniref:N-acetyltransferase domain-containing protein n=1 Tax=Mya arenaria TaxID=6604 RepID=A0ABY7FLB6_MYAAR|nr:hypothetical protein MAR_036662 [Mya arenaria]
MADSKGENIPLEQANGKQEHAPKLAMDHYVELDHETFTRPGAQISDKQTFTNKKGETISGYAVIVDFRRLLLLAADLKDHGIIPGVSNRDLLHACIGLYDVSLSEMTPDVLYSTCLDEYEGRRQREPREEKEEVEEEEAGSVKGSEIDEDVYEEEEGASSKFAEVYSDTESEDADEEDDDDEEDFSKGINTFISSVTDRRKARKTCDGPVTEDILGIENRIIGCATFEKKYVKHRDRVIHLTIVSVRKRCRGFGVGRYLLSQVVEPKVVGNYDAVVVHADNEAVDFFQKELAEQFTNCTLMCYLPGFSGHRLLSAIKIPGVEMFELEQELLKWKEKTLEVYQQQVTCMMRMKHEIIQLKYTATTQDKFLKALVEDNEMLKTEKMLAEQFKQQMILDTLACKKCEVTTISKALVPEKTKKAYKERIKGLADPTMVLDIFYMWGVWKGPVLLQVSVQSCSVFKAWFIASCGGSCCHDICSKKNTANLEQNDDYSSKYMIGVLQCYCDSHWKCNLFISIIEIDDHKSAFKM